MKLILLNKKYIIKKASQYTSYIFSGIGVIGLLAPTSEIFPQELGLLVKIFLAITCVCLVFLACAGKVIANLKKNKVFLGMIILITSVQIYLIYHGGDLFRTYGLTAKEFFLVLIFAASVIPIDFLRKIYIRRKNEIWFIT